MSNKLLTVHDANQLIAQNRPLLVAGSEAALAQLAQGTWIGGTIEYFMTDTGGSCTDDALFVTDLSEFVASSAIRVYDETNIASMYVDAPDNSVTFVMIPAFSATHLEFALHAPEYPRFATAPVAGWITGVNLADLGKVAPKVFVGDTGQRLDNACVAIQAVLPRTKAAEIGIINIFTPGDGDVICFQQDGFSATHASINGETRPFAEYLTEVDADTRLPLVADYYGAMINVSFQNVDAENGVVTFYAPVFAGVNYKVAKPVIDYVKQFTERIPDEEAGRVVFSCNCILNYLYSELEGKTTGAFAGPITFGEVGYQLLNQTLVYVTVVDVDV